MEPNTIKISFTRHFPLRFQVKLAQLSCFVNLIQIADAQEYPNANSIDSKVIKCGLEADPVLYSRRSNWIIRCTICQAS
jgi:hypothetical protein